MSLGLNYNEKFVFELFDLENAISLSRESVIFVFFSQNYPSDI